MRRLGFLCVLWWTACGGAKPADKPVVKTGPATCETACQHFNQACSVRKAEDLRHCIGTCQTDQDKLAGSECDANFRALLECYATGLPSLCTMGVRPETAACKPQSSGLATCLFNEPVLRGAGFGMF